jgi:hypothetical protein
VYDDHLAGRRLLNDIGFEQSLDESQARSIGAGGFGGIHLDQAIVDLQSSQGRHDVFDQFNGRSAVGNGGASLSGNHVFERRGDGGRSGQVDPLELNACVFVRGKETECHVGAGQKAEAMKLGRTRNGALTSRWHGSSLVVRQECSREFVVVRSRPRLKTGVGED